MSDTSELLTTYMNAGAVGEAPRHLQLTPPLEVRSQVSSDLQPSSDPTQSIGSSALSGLVPEFIGPDQAPAKGIRRPGSSPVGLAPRDEFGQRIFAITDRNIEDINPDVLNDLERRDFLEHSARAEARHKVNVDRFVANILGAGRLKSVDDQIKEHEEALKFAPNANLLPSPKVPPIIDSESVKRSIKTGLYYLLDATKRYSEKPLLKDKQ